MNKSDLVELKYLSEAEGDINVWGLTDIVHDSTTSNAQHGITGILFFDHGYFGQILEGTRSAIEETWERIKIDTRHRGIELLGITEIQERRFPKWAMKLFDAKEFSESFPQFAEIVNKMDDPYVETLRMMKQLWQKV